MKKVYIKPEFTIVEIGTENILAGSTTFQSDVTETEEVTTGDDALSKRNSITLWE